MNKITLTNIYFNWSHYRVYSWSQQSCNNASFFTSVYKFHPLILNLPSTMKVQVCFCNPPFKAHHCCTSSEPARSQHSTPICSSAAPATGTNPHPVAQPFPALHSSAQITLFSVILAAPWMPVVEAVVPFKQLIRHLLIYFFETSVVISAASFNKAAIFSEADH